MTLATAYILDRQKGGESKSRGPCGHVHSQKSLKRLAVFDSMKNIPVKIPNLKASKRALVDDEDLELLSGYKWFIRNGYAVRSEYLGVIDGKSKCRYSPMHRIVMKAEKGQTVDHVNGDRLDNRRQNLRFVDMRQNSWNRCVASNSTYGYKGVSFNKKNKRFYCRIVHQGKRYRFGYFLTAEEAAETYKKKELEFWGEFARA